LEEVLDAIVAATWKAPHAAGYTGEVARTVDSVALYDLLALAVNERATTQVRAVAWREADKLKGWLKANKASGDAAQQAHMAYAAAQIEQFQKDPKKLQLPVPPEPPDGPPIGDDEEFVGLPN
jgi:hypothetical protein